MTFDQKVRLDDDLIATIRAYAETHHISVADAIRVLISKGLAAENH